MGGGFVYPKGGGTKEASKFGALDRFGKSAEQAHEDRATTFRPHCGPSPPLGPEIYGGRRSGGPIIPGTKILRSISRESLQGKDWGKGLIKLLPQPKPQPAPGQRPVKEGRNVRG